MARLRIVFCILASLAGLGLFLGCLVYPGARVAFEQGVRRDDLEVCLEKAAHYKMFENLSTPAPALRQRYCQCMSDGIGIGRHEFFAMLRKDFSFMDAQFAVLVPRCRAAVAAGRRAMMRRYLMRAVLVWAVSLPLFYFAVLPWLMDKLQAKARAQNYASCVDQLAAQGMGRPGYPTQAHGETYCHCAMDGLTFTQADLMDIVRHRQPAALNERVNAQARRCEPALYGSDRSRPSEEPWLRIPPSPASKRTLRATTSCST